MQAMQPQEFLTECLRRGFSFFTGTPCSYLKPLINAAIDEAATQFVGAVNEGEAVAMAAGQWLAGKKAVVMFQNSGLGNAVNPITSLNQTFRIPFLGIVTLRGEPQGPSDEPQHQLMGEITTSLLTLMKIPWAYCPQDLEGLQQQLQQASHFMDTERTPFFFVLKKGQFANYELKKNSAAAANVSAAAATSLAFAPINAEIKSNFPTANIPVQKLWQRKEILQQLVQFWGSRATLVATTGKCGRELFDLADQENNFYMVGSMGCALALGLGVALAKKHRPVCVIDGDGALMMRMGTMTLMGVYQPKNILHILLDNRVHDSTGGQSSGAEFVRFAQIARGCGYYQILETHRPEELQEFMLDFERFGGPAFVHFLMRPGSPEALGRPTVSPVQVADRLRSYLVRN